MTSRSMLDGARIFHVNVNCSSLARSLPFYTQALGLAAATHTAPDAVQDGRAFGLTEAQWDAHILTGTRGFDGGAVDLLEWKVPLPAMRPPETGNEIGWQRLGVTVPSIDGTLALVDRLGGHVPEPPHESDAVPDHPVRLAHVADPDGVRIELIEGRHAGLTFVAVCCADLDASRAWYRSLGFTELATIDSDGVGGAAFGLDAPAKIREVVLGAPGGGAVTLILVGFDHPPTVFVSPRPANALGAWRVALLVDDLGATVSRLRDAGVAQLSEPTTMAMGDGLPVLTFVCFRGPDGEVLELIESPRT